MFLRSAYYLVVILSTLVFYYNYHGNFATPGILIFLCIAILFCIMKQFYGIRQHWVVFCKTMVEPIPFERFQQTFIPTYILLMFGTSAASFFIKDLDIYIFTSAVVSILFVVLNLSAFYRIVPPNNRIPGYRKQLALYAGEILLYLIILLGGLYLVNISI